MPLLATDGAAFWPPVFVIGFLWLSLAIGHRCLLWFRLGRAGTFTERAIIAVGVGIAALQFVPYSLGAVGALGERSLRVAVCALALIATKDLLAVGALAWREIRWPRPTAWQIGWAIALSPPILFALLLALAPTTDPDGLGYHLPIPKQWLQSGSLGYLPTYTNSNTPMGMEMLFLIAMSFVGDVGAKCLHFSLGVLGAIGLVLAGKRLHGTIVGMVAATLFLVGPVAVVPFLGRAYIEGAVAFAMIAAVLAWLVWFQSRQFGWLQCAALLAGVAVSFKITSALFPLALGAFTLIANQRFARVNTPDQDTLETGALVGRLLPYLAVPVLPWLVRSAVITGNPFFPLFAGLIPSRDLSPASAAALDRYFRYWNWGTNMGVGWNLERRRLLLFATCGAVALVGGYAFTRLRSEVARRSLLVLIATVVMQIYAVGLYTRYWSMLAPLLALPVLGMFGHVLSSRWIPKTLVALTLVGAGVQVHSQIREADGDIRGLVRTAVGLEDRRSFLLGHLPLFPIYEYANRELPREARILLIYNCHGFYLDRTTFCDESFQNSFRWTTWDDFLADVRRLGVTHVIAPTVLAMDGPPPPVLRIRTMLDYERENELISRLLKDYAQPLSAAADQGLYVVDTHRAAVVR